MSEEGPTVHECSHTRKKVQYLRYVSLASPIRCQLCISSMSVILQTWTELQVHDIPLKCLLFETRNVNSDQNGNMHL